MSDTPKIQLVRRKKVTRFKDSIDYDSANVEAGPKQKIISRIPPNSLFKHEDGDGV